MASDLETRVDEIAPDIYRLSTWIPGITEHGFTGSYYSVRRFVTKLEAQVPLPFRRLECAPGEEAQIDFGSGAPLVGEDGRRRRTHVFRVVLSHSRKAYSEVVYRQTTESFVRCLENACPSDRASTSSRSSCAATRRDRR